MKKNIIYILAFLSSAALMASGDNLPKNCLSSPQIQSAKYFKDQKTLCLNGSIDSSTLYAFERDFLPLDVETVVLNSTGGTFFGGKEVSKLINERNITTVVPNGAKCMSNCVWVFSAGKERYAGRKSKIGIHYVYRILAIKGKVAVDLELTDQYLLGIDDYSATQTSSHYLHWSKEQGLDQEIWQNVDHIVDRSFTTRSFWTPPVQVLYDIGLVTRMEPAQNEIRK